MKYFYIIIILLTSLPSFAEEICMNEEKFQNMKQLMELDLVPKLSIKSNIDKITVYTVIRDELDKQKQSKSFLIIDTFTNQALTELRYGLSQMDENIYKDEFKRDIFMLIKGLIKSRKNVPVVAPVGDRNLEELIDHVQYNKESNQ